MAGNIYVYSTIHTSCTWSVKPMTHMQKTCI